MCKPRHLFALTVVLLLLPPLAGCNRKKKQEEEPPPAPAGNPLNVDRAGGAPAQGAVRRGAQRVVNQELLRDFGQYYAAYKTDDQNGQPPRTVDQFRNYLARDPNARNLVTAIDKGWVEWRLDPPPAGSQVLAYEKDEFQLWHNRLVLFGDGSVAMKTTAQLEDLLKAQ
jgi:hypothetical protein